jgi:hypothetical protein
MTHIRFYQHGQNETALTIIILIILILASTGISCRTNRNPAEGITGKVLWFEGDLMPGIDKKPVKGIPVKREIHVYKPTLPAQTEVVDGVFYRKIQTELVKKTTSDEQGNFMLRLEPGKYTLFVQEPAGLFANKFSGEGFINLVEVNPREMTEMEIRIDYMAAY